MEMRCPACGKRQVYPVSEPATCRRCGADLEALRGVVTAARRAEAAAIAALRAGDGGRTRACATHALRLAPSPEAARLARLGQCLSAARHQQPAVLDAEKPA